MATTPKRPRPKAKPTPSFTPQRPLFTAVHRMKRSFGHQDHYINIIEISIRHFEDCAENEDLSAAFARVANSYGISVNWPNLDAPRVHLAGMYAIQAQRVFDGAPVAFRREYISAKKIEAKTQIKGEGKLGYLLRHLPFSQQAALTGTAEFALLDYYRLIRNAIVHAGEAPKVADSLSAAQLE